jgi:hypothetical protein
MDTYTGNEGTSLMSSGPSGNQSIGSSYGNREDGRSVGTQQSGNPYAQPSSRVGEMKAERKAPQEQGDEKPANAGQPDSCLERCCEQCGNTLDNDCCTPLFCASCAILAATGVYALVKAANANAGKGKTE